MSLPMRLFTLFVFAVGFVLSPSAQERIAQTPATTAASPNQTALLQKISYLTQLVKILEDQLQACSAGQGITCPSVLAQPLAVPVSMESAPASTYTHAQPAVQSAPQASAPAPAIPARRHTMGYQQTSDSRLGCDDYSLSYFRRHPAMAAVCGVNAQQPATPAPVQQPSALPEPEDSDATDISTTTVRP